MVAQHRGLHLRSLHPAKRSAASSLIEAARTSATSMALVWSNAADVTTRAPACDKGCRSARRTAMHGDTNRRRPPLLRDQRTASVMVRPVAMMLDEHRRSPLKVAQVLDGNLDVAIASANLCIRRVSVLCDRRYPLPAFAVGADHEWIVHIRLDPS